MPESLTSRGSFSVAVPKDSLLFDMTLSKYEFDIGRVLLTMIETQIFVLGSGCSHFENLIQILFESKKHVMHNITFTKKCHS